MLTASSAALSVCQLIPTLFYSGVEWGLAVPREYLVPWSGGPCVGGSMTARCSSDELKLDRRDVQGECWGGREMRIRHTKIELVRGDIVEQDVDAIVNAANSSLLGGGGVDGAIHRAAGPELLQLCRTLGGCPAGQARITPGFRLQARYIIHTVGPIYRGGGQGEAKVLAAAHRSSLELAVTYGLHSVAFPAISTGIYGYPLDEAAFIAIETVSAFVHADTSLDLIRFVLWDDAALRAYTRALEQVHK